MSQEVKSGLITSVFESGFSFGCQLVLEALEELRVAGMEVRYDVVATRFEEKEVESLELVVARLRWVEIREDPVTPGELGGWHASPREIHPRSSLH
jgi:hypothetical protein